MIEWDKATPSMLNNSPSGLDVTVEFLMEIQNSVILGN